MSSDLPKDHSSQKSETPVLVTGSAGFIGSHVTRRLLKDGRRVIGLDNFNSYYDPKLKADRLALFENHEHYRHETGDLQDREFIEALFEKYQPQQVIHLAAQAGVRYAAENPHVYVESNVTGTLHILEGCRQTGVEHLVFASTSSVYGANTKMPFSEHDSTEHPLTLYAATKKANEMMAHNYAHLYDIPCTGLRFFTVYGPWGRPDMSPILFADRIMKDEPIKVFNYGKHKRSFTYVDDIVEGIVRILYQSPKRDAKWDGENPDPSTSGVAPYRIFNIGNEQTVEILRYIKLIEKELGREARMDMLPMQPGDVPDTESDVTNLSEATDHRPQVSVEEGVSNFVRWYRGYYKI